MSIYSLYLKTWLTPEKNVFIRGFNIIRKDGPSVKSGGVMIAIKDDIPFNKINNLFSQDNLLETVGISIPTRNNFLHIIFFINTLTTLLL